MKTLASYLTILCLVLMVISLRAQTLTRSVIGAVGSVDPRLSYTVGEVAITTGAAPGIILTQGFQQPDIPGSNGDFFCNLPDVHTIDGDTLSNGDYRAATSVDFIGGTLLTGSELSIAAGSFVRLQPGFAVQAGSDFRTFIEACSTPVLSQEETETMPEFIPAAEIRSPGELRLRSFPNPFRSAATIEFFLPQDGPVLLIVTDLNGRIVARLIDGVEQPAGWYRRTLGGSALEAGMYVVLLRTAVNWRSEKLVLLR